MSGSGDLSVDEAELRLEAVRRSGSASEAGTASALLDLSAALDRADRTDAALAAAGEAVRGLAPEFLAKPAALAAPMREVVSRYVALAGRSGTPADASMLAPIAQALADLDRRDDAEDD